eukprot:UC4_evm4s351
MCPLKTAPGSSRASISPIASCFGSKEYLSIAANALFSRSARSMSLRTPKRQCSRPEGKRESSSCSLLSFDLNDGICAATIFCITSSNFGTPSIGSIAKSSLEGEGPHNSSAAYRLESLSRREKAVGIS